MEGHEMRRCIYLTALVFTHGLAYAAEPKLLDRESSDQWRGSKLEGVRIYGPDDRLVGKITDVLLGKSGKAQYVIVGVGGFLGIGEKDVAIPFDAVDFADRPVQPPANPAGFNNTMGGTSADGGVSPAAAPAGAMTATNGVAPPAGTVGLGTPAGGTAVGMSPDMSGDQRAAQSTAFPDHGTIAMTADQLRDAPSFKFSP